MKKAAWILGGVTAGSVGILSQNNWDPNSIGAVRFGRAALTFGSIAVDYKLSVYTGNVPKDEEALAELWSKVHLRSAKRLLGLCEANRGVFIKVGQHIGAMEYLLPPEYTKTLQVLHAKAPQSTLQEVYSVIEEDLKANVSDLFLKFDPQPLGAASLAQVYKAELSTGETVAVKVQHREVRAHSAVDMATMEFLVGLAGRMFPDFRFKWLAEATRKNLPLELDFLNEGRNAEKTSDLLKNLSWLKIPKIFWKHSSDRVLVMEFCEGGFVNDLEYIQANKLSPKEVARKLGQMYSDMIFIHGLVHCDPHPGNILVKKDENGKLQIVLLDHGLYAELSHDFRYNYSQLWLSIMDSDVEGMKKYSGELGVGEFYHLFSCVVAARSWDTIVNKKSGGIVANKVTTSETEHIRKSISMYIPQLTQIFEKVPRAMILVLKTNDLLRGIEHSLNIRKTMASFLSMSKCLVRAVYSERIRNCQTNFCVFKNYFKQQWSLFRIRTFEIYLWFVSTITWNALGFE